MRRALVVLKGPPGPGQNRYLRRRLLGLRGAPHL